jgi:signal recognition particle subunit SRP54
MRQAFNERLGIDGIILTKQNDGDTRGGAALSVRAVTGNPLIVGMEEKLDSWSLLS